MEGLPKLIPLNFKGQWAEILDSAFTCDTNGEQAFGDNWDGACV